jgi:iron complex transport system ATP-binding protein
MKLTIQDLTFSYNKTPTLNRIDLELRQGDMLGIAGPNGSGKTTLIKCMNRKLNPRAGTVLIGKTPLLTMKRKDIAKKIGVVPQVSSLSFPFSVYDLVMMGRYAHKGRFENDTAHDQAVVSECLARTGLRQMIDRPVTELSGGEYQKVIIARALAQEPEILLLDEVTLHLDIHHQIEILDLIRRLCLENKLSAVMVLHDLSLAARYCTRMIMLKNGRIFASGKPEEVITTDNLRAVYRIEAEIGRSSNGRFLNVFPLSSIATPECDPVPFEQHQKECNPS